MASEISDYIKAVCDDLNFDFSLKKEQIEAIINVCLGRDSFCLLPTGFGKSEILGLPPLVVDKVSFYIPPPKFQ